MQFAAQAGTFLQNNLVCNMLFHSHAAHTFSKLLRRSLSDLLGKNFKDAF
jgi:hypothetical protein